MCALSFLHFADRCVGELLFQVVQRVTAALINFTESALVFVFSLVLALTVN